MATDSALIYGTLDTQASTAWIEAQAGITMAMLELNWASFEPRPRHRVRLLPGHHEVLPAGLPGRRAARHPRPGPAEPAVLGVLPARRQLRGPERPRPPRGGRGVQPGRPPRRRPLPVPGRRAPADV